MKEDVAKVRTFALISHGGAGKTSLAEAMLFDAGVTTRLGKVDEGTSVMDYEPEEVKTQGHHEHGLQHRSLEQASAQHH